MKKQILSLIGFCLLSITVLSQNNVNLVIFSEDGDPFYAYINGVKQNNQPETNVKVTGLSPNISLRVEFENKALPQLKQSMALESGFEHTARIKRDMKKQVKLRYFGRVPLEEASTGVPTVAYHTADNSGYNVAQTQPAATTPVATQPNGSSNTIVSSTTTTSQNVGNNENVNMNVNMNGMGINMNVNANGMDPNMNTNMTTTTSKTVTVTHSSSGSMSSGNDAAIQQQQSQPAQVAQASNNTIVSASGCSAAMSPANFAKMKQSVQAKPFSDTKMSTAKIATKNNCLSIGQVKEICKLFSMDDDKLAYAKFAHAYCVDKSNYYQVSEVFSFSATTDELNQFLEQQ